MSQGLSEDCAEILEQGRLEREAQEEEIRELRARRVSHVTSLSDLLF